MLKSLSLNPCCNGKLSKEEIRMEQDAEEPVLILVVMENFRKEVER